MNIAITFRDFICLRFGNEEDIFQITIFLNDLKSYPIARFEFLIAHRCLSRYKHGLPHQGPGYYPIPTKEWKFSGLITWKVESG